MVPVRPPEDATLDFELGPEERAFLAEVLAFLRDHASPD